MAIVQAFATTNLFSSLGASAYTWSNAYSGSDRAYVSDGKLDRKVVVGSPASNIELVIDLGSAQVMKGLALLNHNWVTTLQGNVAVTVKGADNAAITTNPVTVKAATTLARYNSDSPRDPRNKDHLLAWGGSTSKRYWQILWTYTGTITYFSLGELFGYGSVTQLTRAAQYGSDFDGAHSITTSMQTLSGDTRSSFLAGPIRQARLQWSDLNEASKEQMANLYRDGRANSGNILWAANYVESSTAAAAAEQDCMLAKLGGSDFGAPMTDYYLYAPNEVVLVSRGREVGA